MGDMVPLWLIVATQLVSVVGDSLGQRASRVVHRGSRRRFVLALATVSALQILVVLAVVQLAAPAQTAKVVKRINGTDVDVCALPPSDPHHRHDCYAQGPLTLWRIVGDCPMILVDGLVAVAYYYGEASLYREPLGVMLLVMAALSSTFIIAPMQALLGLAGGATVGALPITLGVVGALLCIVERTPPPAPPIAAGVGDGAGDNGEALLQVQQPTAEDGDRSAERWPTFRRALRRQLPLLLPFAVVSVVYAAYFVLMRYYDEVCGVNPWGFNSFDQGALPLFIFPAVAAADAAAACAARQQHYGGDGGDGGDDDSEAPVDDESFFEAVRHALREELADGGAGFACMFAYRLLINARALSYTFIVEDYDLSRAYLELTLVRVVLSWLASLLLVLGVPAFIGTDGAEKRRLLDPVNGTAKVCGTAAVVAALFIINKV
jgi:hypothetical protein